MLPARGASTRSSTASAPAGWRCSSTPARRSTSARWGSRVSGPPNMRAARGRPRRHAVARARRAERARARAHEGKVRFTLHVLRSPVPAAPSATTRRAATRRDRRLGGRRRPRPASASATRARPPISWESERLWLDDLDGGNGVFIRIRSPVAIGVGSEFVVGDQLLRLERNPAADDGPAEGPTYFLSSLKGPSSFRVVQLFEGGAPGACAMARETLLQVGSAQEYANDLHPRARSLLVAALPLRDRGAGRGLRAHRPGREERRLRPRRRPPGAGAGRRAHRGPDPPAGRGGRHLTAGGEPPGTPLEGWPQTGVGHRLVASDPELAGAPDSPRARSCPLGTRTFRGSVYRAFRARALAPSGLGRAACHQVPKKPAAGGARLADAQHP